MPKIEKKQKQKKKQTCCQQLTKSSQLDPNNMFAHSFSLILKKTIFNTTNQRCIGALILSWRGQCESAKSFGSSIQASKSIPYLPAC